MMATPQDLAAIDRLIKPSGPPERIYGWLNSQLSLARHYGGLKYQGHDYQIAFSEEHQPLVRVDVLAREAKEKVNLAKAARKAQKLAAQQAQEVLL